MYIKKNWSLSRKPENRVPGIFFMYGQKENPSPGKREEHLLSPDKDVLM
jgi:hypothetical protein